MPEVRRKSTSDACGRPFLPPVSKDGDGPMGVQLAACLQAGADRALAAVEAVCVWFGSVRGDRNGL
jgi:hypothetical protein